MDIVDVNSAGPAESSAPAADRLVSGHPRQQLWNAFSDPDGHFHVGRWSSTEGAWKVRYTERELCHLLSGVVRLTDDKGRQRTFRAGDTFMIDKGYSGTWEVLEACSKVYAIYE